MLSLNSANNQASNKMENKRKVGNEVIRKGYLGLHNGVSKIKGGSRDFWFVLTTESLSWFKDEMETEKRYMLSLDQLKLKDLEASMFSRRHSFAIFSVDGRNVYRDYKTLELSCDSSEDVDAWKASFLRAGVYPEKERATKNEEVEIVNVFLFFLNFIKNSSP